MYVMYNDEIPEGNTSYPFEDEKGHTKGEYEYEFIIIYYRQK